jgi:hypothetical protein
METIQKGTVVNLQENNMHIDRNYNIFINGVPVGTCRYNLKWFFLSKDPEPEEIKMVVFVKHYVWGVRELTSIADEFSKFDANIQEDILLELVNVDNVDDEE